MRNKPATGCFFNTVRFSPLNFRLDKVAAIKKIKGARITICLFVLNVSLNQNISAHVGVKMQRGEALGRHRCGKTGKLPFGNETQSGNEDLFLGQRFGGLWFGRYALSFLHKLVILRSKHPKMASSSAELQELGSGFPSDFTCSHLAVNFVAEFATEIKHWGANSRIF